MNPDKVFEKFGKALIPLWGPFYAVFYIMRILWKEVIRREE